VLGCTHYPFLRPVIEHLVGPDVLVIDTGAAVARQTARVLDACALRARAEARASYAFLTSGHVGSVEPVMRSLWGDEGLSVAAEPISRRL
jgi:glutamate racemase